MILFLDIDGVLHPGSDGQAVSMEQRFCCLPQLTDVLQGFPSVGIVISSMWRYDFDLPALRAMLPEIADRIIGVTPMFERGEGELPVPREQEILQWLKENDRQSDAWIAIDDAGWQFIDHKHRLVHCTWYDGFCERDAARLRALLEAER